ncbi:MAG: MBL fold metallo-hydrolase [Armatimonadetes bacterium]|nr:MBL fold metallo-hydrolase [Armatimonadota bacterium]
MIFEEGKIRELAPHVFLRPAVDNSLWADLGDGAVVVDGLEDAPLAPVIRDAVRQTTGQAIRWVVNTHWHRDHTACNPEWAREGATIIAHESAAPATPARDGRPDVTFSDRYTLRGGARQVELEWLGGAHTPEDSVVWLPRARVLHVGDLFGWGLIPLRAIAPESIARLREVYARLLTYDADVVVPGHGPTLTPAELRGFLVYFDDVVARVPALCRAGRTPAEVARAVPPPEDMRDWWRFADWKHARNIEQLCRAASALAE